MEFKLKSFISIMLEMDINVFKLNIFFYKLFIDKADFLNS